MENRTEKKLNLVNTATVLSPDVVAEVSDMFTYHPWNSAQVERGTTVRKALIDATYVIILNVPPGPDRSTALRKLREARMDCNSAITHAGKY